MIIWTQEHWTRESVAADTEHNYIFGDNLKGKGMKGQACIRGLPNAFGVPTKHAPRMDNNAFFSDADYSLNINAIEVYISDIPRDKPIVINSEIGRGLAEMDRRAPMTYKYLITKLKELCR